MTEFRSNLVYFAVCPKCNKQISALSGHFEEKTLAASLGILALRGYTIQSVNVQTPWQTMPHVAYCNFVEAK